MDTMSINNEKLQSFVAAVNTQIDDRVSALLNEAESEKNRILKNAETEAIIATKQHIAMKSKKNTNQYTRDISKAELEMKKDVLRHREALTDQVFDVVQNKLSEFRKTPKYLDSLVKSLIFMNVSGDVEIFLSPDDMGLADTLKKAVKSASVVFTADEKILLGGLSVYNKSKGTITDKTFDLAIEDQKRNFTNSNAFAE